MKLVKSFTLDPKRWCSQSYCTGLNKKARLCAVGQYFNRCGVSKRDLITQGKKVMTLKFPELDYLINEIVHINDNGPRLTKDKIEKLKSAFRGWGIKMRIKK